MANYLFQWFISVFERLKPKVLPLYPFQKNYKALLAEKQEGLAVFALNNIDCAVINKSL
jgi:hypothetical protein